MGERFGKIQAPRELTRAGGQMATPAGQQPPAAKHVATEVGVRRGRIAASDKKKGGTDYLSESGMKWMSGGAKRRCGRT